MKQGYRISRLAKKEESATVKRIFVLSAISGLLAVFIFTLGIPLLGKFADFLELILGSREQQPKSEGDRFISAPTLAPIPAATNSAAIDIKGFASEGEFVELYLNGISAAKVELTAGNFTFEDVKLADGENTIAAKTLNDSQTTSDFSKTLSIRLDKQPPSLIIDEPREGQAFSGNNRIKVSGKTDADSQVYANGFLASVDQEGKFEVFVPVSEGDSTIEIRAIDDAGNVTSEKRAIHFSK